MNDADFELARATIEDVTSDLESLAQLTRQYLKHPSTDGSPSRVALRKQLTDEVDHLFLSYRWPEKTS